MRPWPADQPPREDTRPTGTSRPLAGGASTVPPMREIARPVLSLNRFGSANGLTLKFRFLLALTLLALAPACLLVLLYQQANQNTLTQAGQKSLAAAAQTNSHTLTQVLANHQAQLARLAQQSSIAQVSQGNGDTQQAETLLQTAGLSTGDALAGMVLNRSDQIVAALPASLEGQRLASSTVLADSGALERFVHAQRSAPMPKVGQSALPVASGTDAALAARAWVATIAFVSPAAPAHSGVVLAIYSLPAMVKSYLSALPSVSNSYASVFATTGTLLGVVGNQALAQQIGQTLAIAPLQHAIHATQATPTSSALIYDDPTTNTQETAAGFFNKDLEMAFLVTAPPGALAPAITGLLQGRNLPLIFLIIFVITSLVATWVALPIVRPIRRATREILASTD
ncbi:MAG TPA: hypothetical protein VKT82_07685, partial [Ktedonobacterales bacterium]|nr:hypothetical protein [Ktedonobacterales bacterium]